MINDTETPQILTAVDFMTRTNSGQSIDLSNLPELGQINIEDIAHSLSHQCRYAGHADQFYSVAEHCVHITAYTPKLFQIYYLLHDAHEYLYQDLTRPLKNVLTALNALGAYSNLCDLCDVIIMEAFALSHDKFRNLKHDIKRADRALAEIEVDVLFQGFDTSNLENGHPLQGKIIGLSPKKAKKLFLDTFNHLTE